MADVGRLVAFSAMWLRSEIGGIGLHHQGSRRTLQRGIAHGVRVFESRHATEGNESAEIDHPFGILPWADEAVKNRAHGLMIVLVNGEGILKGSMAGLITGVDDDVEFGRSREFEMLAEKRELTFAKRMLGPSIGRGMIVIEPRFADRTNPGILDMFREFHHCIIRRMMNIAGMDSDAGCDSGLVCGGKIRK